MTGFRPTNWTRAKSVQVGDLFLCYLIGAKRWTGVLRVTSDRYLDETERIFRDDLFPVRFKVEPLVMLSAEHGVPMEYLRGKLSFFPADGTSKEWSGHVRSSPTKFADEDGEIIRRTLESSARQPISIPIDPKVMAGRKKKAGTHPPSGHARNVMENPTADERVPAAEDESSKVFGISPVEIPEGLDEGDAEIQEKEGVSIEKADRSLSELHRWYRNGRLVIDPEWQRSYVWDNRRASKLVESFLMDIPIPVVYLAKTEDGKYEVIDGVQRPSL